jgi:hypothetical protein
MLVTEELVDVKLKELREEARRCGLAESAARSRDGGGRKRRWQWRVEPGMEGTFGSLLGWLLSSQRDAKVEMARSQGEPPRVFAEHDALEDEPVYPFECLFECWAYR